MVRWISGPLDQWSVGSVRWISGPLDQWFVGSVVRWISGPWFVLIGVKIMELSERVTRLEIAVGAIDRQVDRLIQLVQLMIEADQILMDNRSGSGSGSGSIRLEEKC